MLNFFRIMDMLEGDKDMPGRAKVICTEGT